MYHREVFFLLCVQLTAVGVGGLDYALWVGQVVVEAGAGQRNLKRTMARSI